MNGEIKPVIDEKAANKSADWLRDNTNLDWQVGPPPSMHVCSKTTKPVYALTANVQMCNTKGLNQSQINWKAIKAGRNCTSMVKKRMEEIGITDMYVRVETYLTENMYCSMTILPQMVHKIYSASQKQTPLSDLSNHSNEQIDAGEENTSSRLGM